MLFVQLIGLIGIGLLIASFQLNKRSLILKTQVASCLAWSLYYFFIGAYTGAGMVLLGAVRSYVFDKYRGYEWIFELSIFVYAMMTLVTWRDWTSLLPFIAMMLASTAMWQKNPRHIRLISFIPTAFWFPYNFLSGSYMGMVGDLVTFMSVLSGVLRFDVLPYMRQRFVYRGAADIIDADVV